MKRLRVLRCVPLALCLVAAACGGSTPSSPTPGPPPPSTPSNAFGQTAGRTIDVSGASNVAGTSITGDGLSPATADAGGAFTIFATGDAAAPRSASFAAAGYVTRQTWLRVPGPLAVVSLIPASFDLTAFYQMFRVSTLLRWTAAPPLRLETRTVQYASLDAGVMTAIDDQMTDAEATGLVTDLTWALPQLTGETFEGFASVTRQTAGAGAAVPLLNAGMITVVRVAGLTAGSGYWGYSRWQYAADGTITGGLTMLDRDFERSNSRYARSLRSHELGHALGYNHVMARPSVMNPAATIEPNDFDRLASRIAFQRLPGNQSPDADPAPGYSVNRMGGTWSQPVF